MNSESIWLIDGDGDDQEMVQQVWKELNLTNELVFFENAEDAINALAKAETAPFIIISELNFPKINGFQFRERMLAINSKKFKSVPFIFWTTQASEEQITHAYNLSVHGFFIKESCFEDLKMTFIYILNYWLKSKMPSKTSNQ
jgi:DNA-binding NarL/FixJ family response regulator